MSFDRLAPHYRWLEAVLAGRLLQRARLAHLPALDGARDILLVGEGPGRFLGALLARRSDARVTVLDASAAMLREAQARVAAVRAAPVAWVHADVRTWAAPRAAYDAVVTCCVLDCFGPATLPSVVARLAAAARPAAEWLHIDFAVPPAGWPRWRAQAVHALMYATFRALTRLEARQVIPPAQWLGEAGFRLQAVRAFSAGLIRSERWRRG